MEEPKLAKQKYTREQIIWTTAGCLFLAFIIYLPIRNHFIDANCNKLALAPHTSAQNQAEQELYYQEQPSTSVPFNYYTTVYDACESSSGLF